jgi:hypothetical protein
MKKPGALLAIQIFSWIVIGISTLFFLLTSMLLVVEGTPDSVYSEFRIGFIFDGMGVDPNNISYSLGLITWDFLYSVLKYSLVLFFIRKKLFKTLLITLIILTILHLAHPIPMVYSIVLLVIFLTKYKSIKEYMIKPQAPSSNDIFQA